MTADVWAELGRIAGIGGVSLGVFLVLFREVIRKKFFSKLTPRHSFVVVVLFMLLAWSVGIAGIGAWVYLSHNDVRHQLPTEVLRSSAESRINCCPEWEIAGAGVAEHLKSGMLHVLQLFGQKRYEEARQELDLLAESEDIVKRFKADYRTAIFFAEKRYREALESVLARYAALPLSDVRYRWDVAYIIYYFRRERGVAEVEQAIAELRQRYRRLDLSYVWMGIQPGAHERLIQSDLRPGQWLHPDQLAILRDVLQRHPDDAFIDHALYFLKEYDRIIREHPRSLILDRAYYARAAVLSNELLTHRELASEELIARICAAYEEFLQRFPKNNLAPRALYGLVNVQLMRSDPVAAYLAVQAATRKYVQVEPELASDDPSQWSAVRSQVEFYVGSLSGAAAEAIHGAASDDVPLRRTSLQRVVALAFFNERNYAKSLQYYDGLDSKLDLGKRERARIAAIRLAAEHQPATASSEDALRIGLAFKDSISAASHASPYFARYLELAQTDADRARALLLQAFAYRNAGDAERMLTTLNELLARFPASDLADDALAEIGVYYVLWGFPDYQKAINVFATVVQRYPNSNAVDNSYNWIAYALMRAGAYQDARKMYQAINSEFPLTRFARYAQNNLEVLDQIDRRGQ